MEYRQLGRSGIKVSVLSFGTATFGGSGESYKAWGETDMAGASRMVSLCLDAGVNLFDTANIYSAGLSEEILGRAVQGQRNQLLISTKATVRMGDGPNNIGASRFHLTEQLDASLRRLNTDYIDIYHVHTFDALTPMEETLDALTNFVHQGKVRYIACSNFSGWQLMKSLAISEKYGWQRYVAHQIYYSLIGREYEWELMPLGIEEHVSALVWSPLGWGRLTGKIRRNEPLPQISRLHKTAVNGPPISDEYLYKVVDALDLIGRETGKSIAQISLNWLLQRPTVASAIIGARNEEQLKQNLGAVGWKLTPEQIARLDAASDVRPIYPYWQQRHFAERTPPPV